MTTKITREQAEILLTAAKHHTVHAAATVVHLRAQLAKAQDELAKARAAEERALMRRDATLAQATIVRTGRYGFKDGIERIPVVLIKHNKTTATVRFPGSTTEKKFRAYKDGVLREVWGNKDDYLEIVK